MKTTEFSQEIADAALNEEYEAAKKAYTEANEQLAAAKGAKIAANQELTGLVERHKAAASAREKRLQAISDAGQYDGDPTKIPGLQDELAAFDKDSYNPLHQQYYFGGKTTLENNVKQAQVHYDHFLRVVEEAQLRLKKLEEQRSQGQADALQKAFNSPEGVAKLLEEAIRKRDEAKSQQTQLEAALQKQASDLTVSKIGYESCRLKEKELREKMGSATVTDELKRELAACQSLMEEATKVVNKYQSEAKRLETQLKAVKDTLAQALNEITRLEAQQKKLQAPPPESQVVARAEAIDKLLARGEALEQLLLQVDEGPLLQKMQDGTARQLLRLEQTLLEVCTLDPALLKPWISANIEWHLSCALSAFVRKTVGTTAKPQTQSFLTEQDKQTEQLAQKIVKLNPLEHCYPARVEALNIVKKIAVLRLVLALLQGRQTYPENIRDFDYLFSETYGQFSERLFLENLASLLRQQINGLNTVMQSSQKEALVKLGKVLKSENSDKISPTLENDFNQHLQSQATWGQLGLCQTLLNEQEQCLSKLPVQPPYPLSQAQSVVVEPAFASRLLADLLTVNHPFFQILSEKRNKRKPGDTRTIKCYRTLEEARKTGNYDQLGDEFAPLASAAEVIGQAGKLTDVRERAKFIKLNQYAVKQSSEFTAAVEAALKRLILNTLTRYQKDKSDASQQKMKALRLAWCLLSSEALPQAFSPLQADDFFGVQPLPVTQLLEKLLAPDDLKFAILHKPRETSVLNQNPTPTFIKKLVELRDVMQNHEQWAVKQGQVEFNLSEAFAVKPVEAIAQPGAPQNQESFSFFRRLFSGGTSSSTVANNNVTAGQTGTPGLGGGQ